MCLHNWESLTSLAESELDLGDGEKFSDFSLISFFLLPLIFSPSV